MPISSQAPGQDAKTQLFRRRLGASSQDIRIPDKLEKDGIVAITENEVNDKASPGYPGEWRPS